jgi:uncharacterized membrane protein
MSDSHQKQRTLYVHPVNVKHTNELTFGERIADRVANGIGSWKFLITQAVLLAGWVLYNGWVAQRVLHHETFDPFPYILLNLCLSVQAAVTGPLLLLAAKRQSVKDRELAEHDFATNQRAEKLTEESFAELQRNTQATLAIASKLQVELEEHLHRGS